MPYSLLRLPPLWEILKIFLLKEKDINVKLLSKKMRFIFIINVELSGTYKSGDGKRL